MSYKLVSTLFIVTVTAVAAQYDQRPFKLKNAELSSFKIDLDKPGGKTLVSRRHADGVTFIQDKKDGHLKTSTGLCVFTGPDDMLQLGSCDQLNLDFRWHFYKKGDFSGIAFGPEHKLMACWDTGSGWQGAYKADGKPLRKKPMNEETTKMGCGWSKA